MADAEYDPREPGWGLVMPFIACEHEGGPYDDDGFCAGYQAGLLDGELQRHVWIGEFTRAFYAPLVPQLDLIAMRNGYVMTVEGTEDEAWVWCSFRPACPDAGGAP